NRPRSLPLAPLSPPEWVKTRSGCPGGNGSYRACYLQDRSSRLHPLARTADTGEEACALLSSLRRRRRGRIPVFLSDHHSAFWLHNKIRRHDLDVEFVEHVLDIGMQFVTCSRE